MSGRMTDRFRPVQTPIPAVATSARSGPKLIPVPRAVSAHPWPLRQERARTHAPAPAPALAGACHHLMRRGLIRSEEHTSELQSRGHLVCRLLLEKKKKKKKLPIRKALSR